jgi:hypothetical protein
MNSVYQPRRLVGILIYGLSFMHAVPLEAQQYPTIVGEWYGVEHGQGDCGTPWSLRIMPKAITGSDTYCEFSDVRRDKWMVTWTGICFAGNDEWQERVVATENPVSGELSVAFSTGGTIIYKSCAPR